MSIHPHRWLTRSTGIGKDDLSAEQLFVCVPALHWMHLLPTAGVPSGTETISPKISFSALVRSDSTALQQYGKGKAGIPVA
jgi:hypothetical protein